MFNVSKGEEGACTIGVPSRAPATSLNSVRAAATYIGGQAVWNDELAAPVDGSIVCGNCHDSSNMVLVAQIYAPIEGWIVVRNQENRTAKVSAKAAPASAWSDFLAPAEPEVKPASKTASAWGDFSFDEKGTDSSVDALTALLEERDLLLTDKTVEKKVATSAKATDSASAQRYATAHQLPCWEVSELEESWALVDEEAAWEGLSAEDVAVTTDGADNEHINRLLKSYFEGEEDVKIVNMVKKQQSSGTQKGSLLNEAEEDKDTKKGKDKAPPGRAQKQDFDDGEGSDSEGNEAGLSRSSRRQQVEAYFQRRVSFYPTQVLRYAYGGTPLWISHPSPLDANAPQNLAVPPVAPITNTPVASSNTDVPANEDETVFQVAANKKAKKSKAAPTSGAKQASGNSQSTPASRIPRCEGCGQARVFECQLMPALLSYISNSSNNGKDTSGEKSASSANVTPAWNLDNPPTAADIQRFQDSLGEGLDFG
eukprot:gene19462-22125_t